MCSGLERLTSRRAWFVPEVVVWGLPTLGEVRFVTLEEVGSTASVLYGTADIGPGEQELVFSQLVDHRGNQLPASIECPRVIPRYKDRYPVFIVGQESNDRCKVARDPDAPGAVTADLLILEMRD